MLSTFGVAVLCWLAVVNIVAPVVFAWDKLQAKRGAGGGEFGRRSGGRVPEKRLFLLMWLGCAFGAAMAMVLLRHKTRKPVFAVTAVFAGAVWLGVIGWFGFG